MTIFAILMPTMQPKLVDEIKQAYPHDHLMVNDTQWLVSSTETVMEVTAKLKIANKDTPAAIPSGSAIVFTVSSYFGRAPAVVWDWIKSKLEAANG